MNGGDDVEYFYIYNPEQADYFIKNGLQVVGAGKGQLKDIYFKFIRDEQAEEVFTRWVERKHENDDLRKERGYEDKRNFKRKSIHYRK
jgi:hypothetical protein